MEILIVDDYSDISSLLMEYFTESGHNTYATDSISEALKILDKQEIELIISDYKMPGGDGVKFRELLLEKQLDSIPFIIFTSDPDYVNHVKLKYKIHAVVGKNSYNALEQLIEIINNYNLP